MKNLSKVAKASENATFFNSIPLYYDVKTKTVYTEKMLTKKQKDEYFYCTDLINKCTEEEIQSFVYRFLWM